MNWTVVKEFSLFDNAMVAGYEMRHWAQSMTPTWLVEVCDETGTVRITHDNKKSIIPSTRLRSVECVEFKTPETAPDVWPSLADFSSTGEPGPTPVPPPETSSNVVSLKKPSKKDKPK